MFLHESNLLKLLYLIEIVIVLAKLYKKQCSDTLYLVVVHKLNSGKQYTSECTKYQIKQIMIIRDSN